MSAPNLPAAWGDAEVLSGLDLVDKAELIAVPHLVTAMWFETNDRDVTYVYVEAVNVENERFHYNDSSSGVKRQAEEFFTTRGGMPPLGEVQTVRLVIPKGLRKSEYEVKDERGRAKTAKTYYWTVNGVSRAEQPAPAIPMPKTKPTARTAKAPAA